MVSVVVFEFRVMRCQPLRRALAIYDLLHSLLNKSSFSSENSSSKGWFLSD